MTFKIIRPFNNKQTDPDNNNSFFQNEVCQAIRVDNQVFLRGQVGQSFDGNIVGIDDPAIQTKQALQNIEILLNEAGFSLQHIVKMNIYVTDNSYRPQVYKILSEIMKGIRYCSTGVQVSALAKPEMLVEIEAHAVISRQNTIHIK